MSSSQFHPVVSQWFGERFGEPTEPQRLGWPAILADQHVLIAAPTGSGKTLAAFLVCIDRLLRQAIAGTLGDETQVVYVSPLKALSNDVRRNLEVPLREIRQVAAARGIELPEIRALVRTGDTPQAERQAMTRRPPHILVTTPESLYLVLTAAKGRETLRTVRTIIVDEIHSLARDKRGSHLSLSLERLTALCSRPPVRIGLSATVQPVDQIARFLVGRDERNSLLPSIIDVGHVRDLDLGIEVPPSELSAVCSHEQWAEVYARLIELIRAHRSTLIFVNTRRLSERVAHNLRQQLGEQSVAAHHGSLSREIRLAAEERLKSGQLKAIVATASLELGIDVGYIDLVCQIGSPRSIATFLQRVGRSGHSLGRVPRGRLFPLTRDELIECLALLRAVRARRLDAIEVPLGPLDILAQQVVAAAACEDWDEDALYALCRRASPYSQLTRSDFDAVLEMLSEGYASGRRRGAYLYRDRVNHRIRARRGARIAAITSGGAIPELGDYRVVTETERTLVGNVNEDFALESIAGDVFILGNTSWRIRHVRSGEVVVNDAQGHPATIPFWLGEAPARTVELSAEVSALREELAQRLSHGLEVDRQTRQSIEAAMRGATTETEPVASWLREACGVGDWPARQAVNYVAAQQAATGLVPTQRQIVFERFFDESGGMQLVIHAPFGGRINRAWGLSLRKRFCRSFDFELQAAADDNGIVLALGPQHSFPIEQLFTMIRGDNATHLLTQALLAVPLFQTRFRWNATRALAVLRFKDGKKVPPYLQRFRSDDLLTAIFPACTACLENRPEDVTLPDHPLVRQTVHDCLHEAMDLGRFLELLKELEACRVQLVARDTREPSPFSHQILNANPYAFLDDAPLEERRTRAVNMRRTVSINSAGDLGQLDPAAIEQVRGEAWPIVRDADELHDTLLFLAALPASEGTAWSKWFHELIQAGRATELRPPDGPVMWVAAERLALVQMAFPGAVPTPPLALPPELNQPGSAAEAWVALVRGRLECSGPVTASRIATVLGLAQESVNVALEFLEGEGFVLRGRFTPPGVNDQAADVGRPGRADSTTANGSQGYEWCERRLLARIHRLTLEGLRRQIQPVEVADLVRFLLEHQRVSPGARRGGKRALVDTIEQLQGFEMPTGAWEHEVLPTRIHDYNTQWLDDLSLSGELVWGRLIPPRRTEQSPAKGLLTRVVPIAIGFRDDIGWLLPPDRGELPAKLRSGAQAVWDVLTSRGALFASELESATGLLPAQLEESLRELAALGLVTADGFAAIRSIVTKQRPSGSAKKQLARWGRLSMRSGSAGGRWSLFMAPATAASPQERAERWATLLLHRYGIVFRDLMVRESAAPPWRDLARVYRQREARGVIRGGRFVAGVAGEQFGSPQAVDHLRRLRDDSNDSVNGQDIISAVDPVNVFGIITDDPRIPALRSNRLLVRKGRLVASLQSGQVAFHQDLSDSDRRECSSLLHMSGLARLRHLAVSGGGRC